MNLDSVRAKMFAEAQAKLKPDDRVAPEGVEFCSAEHDGYSCTKAVGHAGTEHVAHGMLGTVEHRWS